MVLIVHGLGEHGGRYARLAKDLNAAGLSVISFDQQGHGLNARKRGCITSYADLLQDIESVLRWMDSIYQPRSLILFGHSMGGNLVLNYALRQRAMPCGVIASSPMIRSPRQPGRWGERFFKMVIPVAGNYVLRNRIHPPAIMSDPEEQQALACDPLFHSRLSLRLGAALVESGRWLLDSADKLALPTLLTHGTSDRITCPQASALFASRASSHLRFHLLQGHLHDPFRDLGRDQVIALYLDFISSLASASPRNKPAIAD